MRTICKSRIKEKERHYDTMNMLFHYHYAFYKVTITPPAMDREEHVMAML